MFITLTIDTNKKKNHKVRLHTTPLNVATGWRQAIHSKKRSTWQKVGAWTRSLRRIDGAYGMNGQISML